MVMVFSYAYITLFAMCYIILIMYHLAYLNLNNNYTSQVVSFYTSYFDEYNPGFSIEHIIKLKLYNSVNIIFKI